jgi:hypothetical protein
MALHSQLFLNDPTLEACAVQGSAYVTPGSVGDDVAKIQVALIARIGPQFTGFITPVPT